MKRFEAGWGSMAIGVALAAATPVLPLRAQEPTTRAVVWHDLVTRDLPASQKFYGDLFGWTFGTATQVQGRSFTTASLSGTPVAGFLEANPTDVNTSQWLTYFRVEDADASVATALSSGAKLIVKQTEVRNRGRSALLLDPEGAPFAIIAPSRAIPGGNELPVNGWLWNELWTRDIDRATTFYGKLLGFTHETRPLAGHEYHLFLKDGQRAAGAIKIPFAGVLPNWLPTLRVTDVPATAARAEALGGRVVMPPDSGKRGGSVAIIADPAGAAVAIQQWNGEGGQ